MATAETKLIRLPASYREWCIFVVFISGGSLLGALGLQEVLGQEPCALCLSQRIALALVGITAFWSMLDSKSRRCYPIYMLIFASLGLILIFRQLWIMWVPGADEACGASLAYLVEFDFPASDIVRAMLLGTADCTEHPFTPLASLLAFALVTFGSVNQFRSSH